MYVDNNGKTFTVEGKVCGAPYDMPKIEFDFSKTQFPSYTTIDNRLDGYLSINSSVDNTVYFDFGDGTPVQEYPFKNIFFYNKDKIHTYTDGKSTHTIKMWFKYPSKVTMFVFYLVTASGSFFKNLNLYNIPTVSINYTTFSDYPTSYGLAIMDTLILGSIGAMSIGIPKWICNSRITRVSLLGSISYTVNNIHELINNTDLTRLSLQLDENIFDMPSNMKDFATLRELNIGGVSNVKEITKNINNCRQLTTLRLGYYSTGYSSSSGSISSWGYGIFGMVNLTNFGIIFNDSTLNPSEDFGLSECPNIKTLDFNVTFRERSRLDLFINNLYTTTKVLASKDSGNTQLRQIILRISWINNSNIWHNRPTGVYQQPLDYIQGSNNGNPATPMEMLWILVKQYRWTIDIMNVAENGIEILAP